MPTWQRPGAARFAFSIPAVNYQAPLQRFQWKVLPQGMMNSPTMCQIYVDKVLQPLKSEWPSLHIYHYMDDILFAGMDKTALDKLLELLPSHFSQYGLTIAPEKIQHTEPILYLGYVVTRQKVTPQKIAI